MTNTEGMDARSRSQNVLVGLVRGRGLDSPEAIMASRVSQIQQTTPAGLWDAFADLEARGLIRPIGDDRWEATAAGVSYVEGIFD